MEVTHNDRNCFDDDGFPVLGFYFSQLALGISCGVGCNGNQALFQGEEISPKIFFRKISKRD